MEAAPSRDKSAVFHEAIPIRFTHASPLDISYSPGGTALACISSQLLFIKVLGALAPAGAMWAVIGEARVT